VWSRPAIRRLAGVLLVGVPVALLAAKVGTQVVGRPPVGLADNGDYERIMRPLGLQHVPGIYHQKYFDYFNTDYLFRPQARYGFMSSQQLLAWPAVRLSPLWSAPHHFDLRGLGVLHGLALLGGVLVLLLSLRGLSWAARAVAGAAVVVVLGDVGYVAYLNSFYCEPATVIFFVWALAATIVSIGEPEEAQWSAGRAWRAAAFLVVAVALFVAAKPQNFLAAFAFAPFVFHAMCRTKAGDGQGAQWINREGGRPRLGRRGLAAVVVAGLLAFALVFPQVASAPHMRQWNLYDSIFWGILRRSPDPARDLRELGLDESLANLAGTHAFAPYEHYYDPDVQARLFPRASFPRIVGFYLRHPARTWELVDVGAKSAFSTRLDYLGNFPASAGQPPVARASAHTTWSNLRESLPHTRWFVLAFFIGSGVAGLTVLTRAKGTRARRAGSLLAALAPLGFVQLVSVIVADGDYELPKHLFLFNLVFDASVVILAACAAGAVQSRLSRSSLFIKLFHRVGQGG